MADVTLTIGDGQDQQQTLPVPDSKVPYNAIHIKNTSDAMAQVMCPGRRLFGEQQDLVDKQVLVTIPADSEAYYYLRTPINMEDPLYVNHDDQANSGDCEFTFENVDTEAAWLEWKNSTI